MTMGQSLKICYESAHNSPGCSFKMQRPRGVVRVERYRSTSEAPNDQLGDLVLARDRSGIGRLPFIIYAHY